MADRDKLRWSYEVLGVSMDASWEEIRHCYRELAQRYHPDRSSSENGAGNAERFKDISRAFHILSKYVKEHGHTPPPDRPAQDPAVDAGKVYSDWRESFQHRPPPPPRKPPLWANHRQRLKRVALLTVPALIVYLVFGFSGSEDESLLDARWSEDVYTPPAVRTDIPAYIRVGMDEDTVRLIQGEPSRKQGDTWYYGKSKVIFENGQVTGWEMDLAYPLRVDLGESRGGGEHSVARFTYGATRLEVEAIQGQPTRREENVWTYGLSKVYFKNGLVVRWENDPRTPLLVYD